MLVALLATGLLAALLYAALGGAGDGPATRSGESLARAEPHAPRAPTVPAPSPASVLVPVPAFPVASQPASSQALSQVATSEAAPIEDSSGDSSGPEPVATSEAAPIEDSSGDGSGPEPAPRRRPPPREARPPRRHSAGRRVAHRSAFADPQDLYREGARLYVAGSLEQARRTFENAAAVSPGFAPAYRGLGLVHERMGRKGRAIHSFETYLRLAPNARDAGAVRSRIESLRL
jgi:hypothetical protein